MSVVNRGDPYMLGVSATGSAVMDRLRHTNSYRLVWQLQVGPSAWMGPQTSDALKGLGRLGKKRTVLVPIAFTSDHIEILYDLDLLGMEAHRAESLNGSPVFIRALADITAQYLEEKHAGAPPTSVQMGLRCPGYSNVMCAQHKPFFAQGRNLYTAAARNSMWSLS